MKTITILAINAILALHFVSAEVPDLSNSFSNCLGSGSNGGYGMMGLMTGYGGWGFGMFLSWILFLLIIALIIVAIYWLIKSANRKK